MAQVVKALAPSSMKSSIVERGFDSCICCLFFQDEGGEIANCKTYIRNVFVALSGNAPMVDSRFLPLMVQ